MQILRLAAALLVLALPASYSQGKNGPADPGAIPNAASPSSANTQLGTTSPEDPMQKKLEHQRLKALNKDRQEALKKDTEKLLKLATELKEAVDQSTQDTLSLEVVRKTEEIEKLSRSIRDKMKDAY